ncbi:MAG: hypothetical protein IJV22_06090 [Bacteroidales bacterium]|nr:hypothetical protein [Bacteroidales bacterium]
MEEKVRKISTWVGLAVAIVGAFFAVIHATGSDSKHELQAGTMLEIGNKFSGMYDVVYGILLCFMAVAIIGILVFVVVNYIQLFKDSPKSAVRSLLAIGLLVALGLVTYLISNPADVSPVLLESNHLSANASKWIGAACYSVYALVIVAVLAIIYVEVSKAFKK